MIYFFGPTVYWKQYLDSEGIAYEAEEISFDLHVKPYLYDYIIKWGENACAPGGYKPIRNHSLVDVVNDVNNVLLQKTINRKAFLERDDIVKLQKAYAKLKTRLAVLEDLFKSALQEQMISHPRELQQRAEKAGIPIALFGDIEAQQKWEAKLTAWQRDYETEIETLRSELSTMENSFSWKITKPLRAIKAWFLRLFRGHR